MTPLILRLAASLAGEPEHFKNKMDERVEIRRDADVAAESRRGQSGPGGPAAGIVGPVAVEPGHAPFDALAEAGKAAVLDDRDSAPVRILPSLSITSPLQ